MMPKRRRSSDPWLEDGEAHAIREKEHRQWKVEADNMIGLLAENPDLPILKGAYESASPNEFLEGRSWVATGRPRSGRG